VRTVTTELNDKIKRVHGIALPADGVEPTAELVDLCIDNTHCANPNCPYGDKGFCGELIVIHGARRAFCGRCHNRCMKRLRRSGGEAALQEVSQAAEKLKQLAEKYDVVEVDL
jgi:hypothetical protein